ncbi:unnamed protein product [Menidia menidia]|uniref:Hyaluronidase n=1 Tax=Menidia menidia TaxID=238744 RepID=A0A8S4B879_9TELE|nr:unnamed protein product [Menidia menidia]
MHPLPIVSIQIGVMMAPPWLSGVLLCVIGSVLALPPTEPPLIHGHPFVVLWNAPTDRCEQLHIPLDTAAFKAVTTPAAVPGQFLTIFYEDRLGLYPKFDIKKQKSYKGGVPQNVNLTEHLAKAQSQIDYYISHDSAPGLAVIDWESWRPLWDQNWGSKRIYQKLSLTRALQMAPHLSSKQISNMARDQFQLAGRRLMEKTISLGIGARPSRRWGFYLFPDCFNYGWEKQNYTGKCSSKIQKQNNQMIWLWERSSALFPSIYLHLSLRNSPQAALYVRHRVQEALRVAALPKRAYTVPVYVYSRLLYRDQTKKLESQMDLVSTVGESAALGASGVVMWGATKDYSNKVSSGCCAGGGGRCVRRDPDSPHYLHLDPQRFRLLLAGGRYAAVGVPAAEDLQAWAEAFTCQCYAGGGCPPRPLPPPSLTVINL